MKHILTPEKVVETLKKHNQEITLEEASIALNFIREMIPIAIENAKKQIAEEDNLNKGSNPAGAGSE